MKTLLTNGTQDQPGAIWEILNAMVPEFYAELPAAGNNKSAVPSTKYLIEKRASIMNGKCNPFMPIVQLSEDALHMGASEATVNAPHLLAIAHNRVVARRRTARPSRQLYLHSDSETLVNQRLDRVQHRILRDENDVEVLRQAARLCDVQIAETEALRNATLERIAELASPLPVAVRWSARS